MKDRITFLKTHLLRIDRVLPGSNFPKHIKMTTSPFVFFRGAAQVFYADLASGNITLPDISFPITTVMGDCHTSNFGFFSEQGSHGDDIIFAANDFDDACFGNPLWDVLRFSISLRLCADHCQRRVRGDIARDRGNDIKMHAETAVSDVGSEKAIVAFMDSYLDVCRQGLAGLDHLDQEFDDFRTPSALVKRYKKAKKRVSGGKHFLLKSTLAKAIDMEQIPLTFRKLKDKFRPLAEDEYTQLACAFAPFMNDAILDIVARQGSGTGSVNMHRYYFLVGPADYHTSEQLPLCQIVEVKQQRMAAPLFYFPDIAQQNNLNPAHLTLRCQRLMQRIPDILLDEAMWNKQHWLIRSRHHAKVGIDPEHIGIGQINTHDGGFTQYARACGTALALAHCRGAGRSVKFEQGMTNDLLSITSQLMDIS